jgi:naphthalene 1,2-dioxygenase system ferredoxin subunit
MTGGGPARVFVALEERPRDGLRAVEADGRRLLLCFAAGGCFALENRCPHAAVPLDQGRLRGFELECPLHGGRLDVRDGRPLAHPIRRSAHTFAVTPVHGGLEIEID